MVKYLSTEPIPEWALCYIFNGDMEGLTDEEIKMVNDFEESFHQPNGVIIDTPKDDQEPYFTHYLAFGLACNVYDLDVYSA